MGKTSLLNRLAAKDITGFPKDISLYFIRHEVPRNSHTYERVSSFVASPTLYARSYVTMTLTC